MNQTLSTCMALLLVLSSQNSVAQVYLPGTQPEEGDIKIAKVKSCKICHTRTGSDPETEPFRSWHGGLMAQAARDPVYLAALAVANQDIPGVGEYCIRCHAPAGWLEGRDPTPPVALAMAERAEAVRAVLTELPEGYSSLLVAKYCDNATAEELAQAEDSSAGAIRSKLARARRAFRDIFAKWSNRDDDHAGALHEQ
jgi:hypothetical protein